MKSLMIACAGALAAAGAAMADIQLNAAVAPNARSVEVGSPATFFATLLNSGDTEATNCRVEADLENSLGTDMDYRRTDAANQAIGATNTPFSIPPGRAQTLVLTVRPQDTTGGAPYGFDYICDEGRVSGAYGISDVYIRSFAEGRDASDLVMVLQTLSGDGVIRIAENGRRGVAAGALVNIGGRAEAIYLYPGFPGYQFSPSGPSELHYRDLLICQTDDQAQCLEPPSNGLSLIPVAAGEVITFNLFLDDNTAGDIPFMPEFLRASVYAYEQRRYNPPPYAGTNGVAGATSVAVSEPAGPGIPDDTSTSGQWYGYFDTMGRSPFTNIRVTLTPGGEFVMTTRPDLATNDDFDFSSEIIYGTVDPNLNGLSMTPTGSALRIRNDAIPQNVVIDGLTLGVQSRMSGRPSSLDGQRVKGYFLRNLPEATPLPQYDFDQVVAGTLDYTVRSMVNAPFEINGLLQIDSNRQDFSGTLGARSATSPEERCQTALRLVAREGDPAPMTFDATLTVTDCDDGNAVGSEGEYSGWAIPQHWEANELTQGEPASCSLLIFLERDSDGTALPLWIWQHYWGSGGRIYCTLI